MCVILCHRRGTFIHINYRIWFDSSSAEIKIKKFSRRNTFFFLHTLRIGIINKPEAICNVIKAFTTLTTDYHEYYSQQPTTEQPTKQPAKEIN